MIIIKTKRLNLRVSDVTDYVIRKKANDANMSISEYMIKCSTGKSVVNYDGLKELTTQIKKLGNNVNQLLILSRQGKINAVNLTQTQEELKRIYELLSEKLSGR